VWMMLLIPDPLIRSRGLGLADLLHTEGSKCV
jgi:hypothetical protein